MQRVVCQPWTYGASHWDSNLESVDSQIRFHEKLTGLIRTHLNQDPTKVKSWK